MNANTSAIADAREAALLGEVRALREKLVEREREVVRVLAVEVVAHELEQELLQVTHEKEALLDFITEMQVRAPRTRGRSAAVLRACHAVTTGQFLPCSHRVPRSCHTTRSYRGVAASSTDQYCRADCVKRRSPVTVPRACMQLQLQCASEQVQHRALLLCWLHCEL